MLEIYGTIAVSLMVIFYALEKRSRHYIAAFGVACLLCAAYGLGIQSYPFACVETVWAGIAFRRWFKTGRENQDSRASV
ncbi:MAG: hypothetical protein AAF236_12795 [Verrucomicrobiota bacterium]